MTANLHAQTQYNGYIRHLICDSHLWFTVAEESRFTLNLSSRIFSWEVNQQTNRQTNIKERKREAKDLEKV